MKITDNVAVNDHPILDVGFWIADFGLRIADLLYRFALSFFIKLTECLNI